MNTKTRKEPRVAVQCRCGCNQTGFPNRMEYIRVPGDTTHRLLLRQHIEPFTTETETLNQLVELAKGLYAWPLHRRFGARNRVRTLQYRLRHRLQGEEKAAREADRAALLSWLPRWIGNRLATKWERE